MIEKITSKQNSKVKYCLKLHQQSFRQEEQKFLIEGEHLLEMALEANAVTEVYTLKERKNLSSSINQFIVNEEILRKIAFSMNPQGVVAICKMNSPKSIQSNRVLLLDGVSDPGNLGTIFRTALAFGYTDILLSKGSCSPYNEKAIQASQGAIFSLNIVENFDIRKIKENGYQIISTEIQGSKELSSFKPNPKHVLVLGNESRGVSQELLDISHERIRINIDKIESLNVAIAGAIVMYHFSK